MDTNCRCMTLYFSFAVQEITHLQKLEESTLNSDLSQGYALKMLTGEKASLLHRVLPYPYSSLLVQPCCSHSFKLSSSNSSTRANWWALCSMGTSHSRGEQDTILLDVTVLRLHSLRLVVQRTKKIDECQELLLQMLEALTTGTKEESMEFMTVCVDTLRGFPRSDMVTPIFVIERLCNIIHPVST